MNGKRSYVNLKEDEIFAIINTSDSDFSASDSEYISDSGDEINKSLSESDEVLENDNTASVWSNENSNLPAVWGEPSDLFCPRFSTTEEIEPVLLAPITREATELHVFKCLFPESLFILFAQCTNERLRLLKKNKVVVYDQLTHQK